MQSMKQEVLVMSVSRYHMVDRETGEINEGTTVRYIFSTDLKPVFENDLKGYKFGKASLPFSEFDKFGEVPAVYDADMNLSIASDGTVKVKAENFNYVRSFVSQDVKVPQEIKK